MKKRILILMSIIMIVILTSCSSSVENTIVSTNNNSEMVETSTSINYETNENTDKTSKSIVIYFSRTNNTEKIANYIIEITGSDRYEIEANVPYTDADINYNNSSSRANQEQNNPAARPEIKGESIDLSDYDIIYLGYPIWWGQAPKIMYTFIEKYDLTSKTIIPFCTSASSPIGTSATNLSMSASEANWLEGKRFSASSTKNDIEIWLKNLK